MASRARRHPAEASSAAVDGPIPESVPAPNDPAVATGTTKPVAGAAPPRGLLVDGGESPNGQSELTLLTSEEAAARLRISKDTLNTLVRRGELTYIQLGGARRYSLTDLAEFVNRRRCEALPDVGPATPLDVRTRTDHRPHGTPRSPGPEPDRREANDLMATKPARRAKRRFGSIRRLPSGRYQARYRDREGGELVSAPYTFLDELAAELWLNERELEIHKGVHLDPRPARQTFADFAKEFLNRRGHQGSEKYVRGVTKWKGTVAERTWGRDRDAINLHILPVIGKVPMGKLRPEHGELVQRAMIDKGHLGSTIRTNMAVLICMGNKAVEWKRLKASPFAGMERIVDRGVSPEIHEGANALVAILAALPSHQDKCIAYLAATGRRWAEVSSFTVRELDTLRQTMQITETRPETAGWFLTPKGPKTEAGGREIALPPELVEMLAEQMVQRGLTVDDQDSLLFVDSKGGQLRRSNWARRVWKPAVAAAGHPHLRVHDLKHIGTNMMFELDVHPRVVQHRLGQSTLELQMKRYGGVSAEVDRAVAKKLGQAVRAAGLGASESGTNVARNPAAEAEPPGQTA